jgi:hypothetical protein
MKSSISVLGTGALVALTFAGAGAGSAAAQTFSFTHSINCIVIESPATFNSAFQPSAGPISSGSSNSAGTITFNSNGTGTVSTVLTVGTTIPVPPQGTFTTSETSAGDGTGTYNFTWTVSNNIYTLRLVSGSYQENALSGPRAGQTATIDVLAEAAYISADGKELLFIADGTYVQTKTWSNGDVRPQVCTGSGRGYIFP